MNITLKQMAAFCAVAEAGSFSRAAGYMHSPQSAISVLVKELELELGNRLLDRTTRRVELTAAGTDFLPAAQKLLSDLRHAVSDAKALGDRKRGRLTVAGPPVLVETLVPKLLLPFKRDFPGVAVTLIDARTERIIEVIRRGEADIGLGTFPNQEEGLLHTPLIQQELMLFCSADHKLASGASVKWKELDGLPIVNLSNESGIRPLINFGFQSAGISPNQAYEVAFMTTALALVEVGLGVAILPPSALRMLHPRRIVAIPLTHPTVVRDVVMLTRHGRTLSAAAAEWASRLKIAMKESFPGRPPKA